MDNNKYLIAKLEDINKRKYYYESSNENNINHILYNSDYVQIFDRVIKQKLFGISIMKQNCIICGE